MENFKNKNPREVAFLALIFAQKEGYLEDFFQKNELSKKDLALAYEIAHGVERRKLSLEFLADQLYGYDRHKKNSKKLKLQTKERLLLYTALYQYFFMDRVPFYAVVDETIKLAKKHFHQRIASFFNALLRSLERKEISLPKGNSREELSYYYSYPRFFIEKLIDQYGLETSKECFELMNKPAPVMVRVRGEKALDYKNQAGDEVEENSVQLKEVFSQKLQVLKLAKKENLEQYLTDDCFYIQNVTPVYLIEKLSENLDFKPEKILDLCSAPGGKLLALKDLFSEAELYANDVSEGKLRLLRENLEKYQIEAEVLIGKAEEFYSSEKFDLIVLDVPCSNSGVLGKRAEARWRLDSQKMQKLQEKQFQMLKHALTVLSEKGQIWYLTCSLLKEENEELIKQAEKELGLKVKSAFLQMPNSEGWDGGFGCSLTR